MRSRSAHPFFSGVVRAALFAGALLGPGVFPARAQLEVFLPAPPEKVSPDSPKPAGPAQRKVAAGTILRVNLDKPVKLSKLQPGSELEGELSRAIYVVDRAVLPAGSHVHLVVDAVDKEAIKAKGLEQRLNSVMSLGFDRKFAEHLRLRSASVKLPDGRSLPLQLSFVQAGQMVELRSKGEQIQVGGNSGGDLLKSAPGVGQVKGVKKKREEVQKFLHPGITLQLDSPVEVALGSDSTAPLVAPGYSEAPATLPAGTHARLLLLSPLSSATSHPGDVFQARLLEPVVEQGRVLLPEGVIFEGEVKKVVPPRRASLAGSLLLTFRRFILPGGAAQQVSASLSGTELNKDLGVRMDDEGGLHGGGRGVKKRAEDFAKSLLLEQGADEVVELATHALAPYVSIPLALANFLARHGRDCALPQYAELEIVFSRPVTVPPATPAQASPPSS